MLTSGLFVDFHTHILPGADHGSTSAEETTGQLQLLKKAGAHIVVATPHFYPAQHSVNQFEKKIAAGLAQLKKIDLQDAPKIILGAEILVCESLHKMAGLEKLCIAGTNCLLLEMPYMDWNNEITDTVNALIDDGGYTVILAHIDRYLKYHTTEINAFLEAGAFAQINLDSLLSPNKRKKLLPYFKKQKVVALGSDLHGTDNKILAKLPKIKKLLGPDFPAVTKLSEALLQNAEYV